MQMPEPSMPETDRKMAREAIAKSAALHYFNRNHKTSDCAISLGCIRLRGNAWQARFVRTFCYRLSD